VLVVYDERLASPGVGAFLNERFREALGDVTRKGVHVRDVTIMTIHDLETKESTDGFSLTELLSAYLPEARGGMISLHNFLARHPTFSAMIRPNETLVATSMAEIEELQKRLFPKLEGEPTAAPH
jgi:hypothetical protein